MTYDLDPTGKSLRNKIIGEVKNIALPAGREHLFVVPNEGPFYAESMFIKYAPSSGAARILIPDVDYFMVFPYMEATRKINAPIFSGIGFNDITLEGTITCTYQTIGGAYLSDAPTISSIETGFTEDPRFTKWESLVTLPEIPTITHPWSVVNVDDISNTVTELEKVGLVVHLRPKFLPSPEQEVFIPTPAEIGLGNVPNYPVANAQQAEQGVETQAFMTPANTKQAIDAQVIKILSENGYSLPIEYTGGLVITSPKTTIEHLSNLYAVRPSAIPYTTAGVWDMDKENFITVRGVEVGNWVRTYVTVTGNEAVVIGLGTVFDVAIEHDCMLLPQLVVNDVNFMVYNVDYKLSDDKLYVSYPVAAGDKLILYTKRSFVNINRESQVNKVFVITEPGNTFDVSDKNINSDNVRVTVNDFIILDAMAGDYVIDNGMLIINYAIGVGDVVEVENIDSMPVLGKAFLRALLNS